MSFAHRGAVLVVCLILLGALTLLSVSSMTLASLEIWMAGNVQYRERAFQAADSAIERAIAAGEFDVATTVGTYTVPPDPTDAPTPVRGTGRRGCLQALPDDGSATVDTADCYEYFVRYDVATGETPVPGEPLGPAMARHFVIDTYGWSARGAEVALQASVCLVGPPPQMPVRTSWRQRDLP